MSRCRILPERHQVHGFQPCNIGVGKDWRGSLFRTALKRRHYESGLFLYPFFFSGVDSRITQGEKRIFPAAAEERDFTVFLFRQMKDHAEVKLSVILSDQCESVPVRSFVADFFRGIRLPVVKRRFRIMKKPGGDFAIAYLRSEMKPFMLIERNIEQGKISPFSKKTAADFQGDFRFQSRILITQSQFFDKTQRPAFGDCADVNGMIRFFDLITVLSRLFIPAGIAFYDSAAGGGGTTVI